jgi:hypothetical protein
MEKAVSNAKALFDRNLTRYGVDPLAAQAEIEAIIQRSKCVKVDSDLIMAVLVKKNMLWIDCAASETHAHNQNTKAGLEWAENQARSLGLQFVGFQTVRPGLKRKALALGYIEHENDRFLKQL